MSIERERQVRAGVFVSYSRKDGEETARALSAEIASRGIAVWRDRTGMEGGRDWWEQIREALDHVEYMVLVMTPAALQSAVVRREWRHARQQGVCVYPVIATPGLDIAALPRWMNGVHWYDLAHEEQRTRLFNDLQTRCRTPRVPFMAEPLPADFVPRGAEFGRLKKLLLSPDRQEPVAITAALRGAGGFGKTTLARALCADEDIQNAFAAGILWVTLGEAPSQAVLLGKLNDLIETLSGARPSFEGLEAASTRLRELLADRDILLVVDDVWRGPDLAPFLVGGARCARLVTTRRADTLPPQAALVPVDQMSPAEAGDLLAFGLPSGSAQALQELASRLGEWPLLLKLANAWLRKRVERSRQPLDRALAALDQALAKHGVRAFDPANPAERNEAAAGTLELSFAGLDPADQQRLLSLAVFEEDLDIPLAVLERFWSPAGEMAAFEVEDACQRLFAESLLVECDLDARFVRLHDAIRAWLLGRPGEPPLPERHRRLLEAYRGGDRAWAEVPDDGYLQAHVAAHLVGAGRSEALERLLLDLDWLQARLAAGGDRRGRGDVPGLLADFDRLPATEERSLVRRALQMSAHVIGPDPGQLAAQLFGRLGRIGVPAIEALCTRAVARMQAAPLRPLLATLMAPGPLTLTLAGHRGPVKGAVLCADGRQALSWSYDGTLKLWDLERGALLSDLAGHRRLVKGAVLCAQAGQALSWSDDGTLKLWDLKPGELLRNLAGHRSDVNGAVLRAEGRQALSWSVDCSLKLWDLERGELLHDLAGHRGGVKGVVLRAKGGQALSWSEDGTLKLWDLERGELMHDLAGHQGGVNGVVLLAEGGPALSWSDDGTLKLWDLGRGELLHDLAGHQGPVIGVLVRAEGRQALSWTWRGELKLWDLERGELLHDLAGLQLGVTGAVLRNEGREALLCSPLGRLTLWDLERGQPLHDFLDHQSEVNGALLRAGDRQALSWSEDGTLKLWDLERRELLQDLAGHDRGIAGALLRADGRQALSWSWDGTLKLWDLEREEVWHELAGHQCKVHGAALRAEGRQALSWSDDGTLKLWDLQRGVLLHDLGCHRGGVTGVVLGAEGRHALSWTWSGELKLWDLERVEVLHDLAGHRFGVNGAVLRVEGRHALSWSDDGNLNLWDLECAELLHVLEGHQDRVIGALLRAEDRQALTWSSDGTLKLWDLERRELLHDLVGHEGGVSGAALCAQGRQALSWSGDSTLKVWDLERGTLLHELSGHQDCVTGAVLRAEGRQALSWSDDGTLKLWDVERGALLHDLIGHQGWVLGAVLRAEGRQALSWSEEGTLKLWDLERGEMLCDLVGHQDQVAGALLLAKGRQALSWSYDGTLKLWRLADGRCLATHALDYSAAVLLAGAGDRLAVWDQRGRMHLLAVESPDAG